MIEQLRAEIEQLNCKGGEDPVFQRHEQTRYKTAGT
jgi:hypothetical protein